MKLVFAGVFLNIYIYIYMDGCGGVFMFKTPAVSN